MQEDKAIANIEVVKEKVSTMKQMVESITVSNDQELEDVANKIKGIKTLGKFIKNEKEKYTKPAMEIIKNAREKYLPYEKECEEAERILKSKAGEYMDKKEEERRKKEEAIEAKVEKGTMKEETALRKMEDIGEEKKTIRTDQGAKLTRKTIKVVDIEDESKIPDEYWVLDMVKVRKVALAGVSIPGVVVRDEKTTSL